MYGFRFESIGDHHEPWFPSQGQQLEVDSVYYIGAEEQMLLLLQVSRAPAPLQVNISQLLWIHPSSPRLVLPAHVCPFEHGATTLAPSSP